MQAGVVDLQCSDDVVWANQRAIQLCLPFAVSGSLISIASKALVNICKVPKRHVGPFRATGDCTRVWSGKGMVLLRTFGLPKCIGEKCRYTSFEEIMQSSSRSR